MDGFWSIPFCCIFKEKKKHMRHFYYILAVLCKYHFSQFPTKNANNFWTYFFFCGWNKHMDEMNWNCLAKTDECNGNLENIAFSFGFCVTRTTKMGNKILYTIENDLFFILFEQLPLYCWYCNYDAECHWIVKLFISIEFIKWSIHWKVNCVSFIQAFTNGQIEYIYKLNTFIDEFLHCL